jgi:hypothetical protein
MKKYYTILLVLLIAGNIMAQKATPDSCIYGKANTGIFIPGQRDTIINGKAWQAIDPSLLVNGFELQLEDTTYRIVGYRVAFDHDSGISVIPSREGRIEPIKNSVADLGNIIQAQLITIDDIRVVKNNSCYRIPGVAYFSK